MAVTISERPKGYILSSAPVDCIITDLGGFAFFAALNHGLTTGDVIYVTTYIEDYNGFVAVEVTSVSTFYIRSLATGDRIDFIVGLDADQGDFAQFYKSELTHGWVCVHLPITYRITNDLYPVNSSDTTRNINSVQEANDYTVLQLSGSLGSVHSYDFVKIDLPNDTELSGVYQITEFISPTVILINLLYDSTNDFTSATAVKQYNNYTIKVRVYAGINASHQWTAQKPYELAATKELIPDVNNEVFFSIDDILRSYVETRNNLVLGTLPNNIDFWTNFYIETAESYDDSDGYTFGTFTTSFTSDQSNFEGTAVNSKLVFKNIYSGYLSEYLMTNNAAKFLTLFSIPVIFSCGTNTPDCYHDISFLNPYDDVEIIVIKEFYSNGNGPVTVETSLGIQDSGVIRAELEADCNYDRVDVSISRFQDPAGGELQNGGFAATLSPSSSVGSGNAWTWSAAFSGCAFATLPSSLSPTQRLRMPFVSEAGVTYEFELSTRTNDGGGGAGNFTDWKLYLTDGVDFSNVVSSLNKPLGTTIFTVTITPTSSMPYIEITAESNNVAGQDREVLVLLVDNTSDPIDEVISETKEFKINCGCATQEIRITWLNNLGGFDYWAFKAKTDDIVEIQEAMTTKKNILPDWPKSYGTDADTIKKQTLRVSNKAYTVRSQFLTQDELDAISYIKSSILVQIINSRTDRRTVLVDTDSFVKRKEGDKTFEIAFNISLTDDIPVQTS